MKTFIGLLASLIVNAAILGTFDWTAQRAQLPPAGKVLIVQLPDSATVPTYADAAQVGSTASRTL